MGGFQVRRRTAVDNTEESGPDRDEAESIIIGPRDTPAGTTVVLLAGPKLRAPDRNLVPSASLLALLGQRRGQRSTLFYLCLP
jgi:hypothetical protein